MSGEAARAIIGLKKVAGEVNAATLFLTNAERIAADAISADHLPAERRRDRQHCDRGEDLWPQFEQDS
jgi:hypothetical protein